MTHPRTLLPVAFEEIDWRTRSHTCSRCEASRGSAQCLSPDDVPHHLVVTEEEAAQIIDTVVAGLGAHRRRLAEQATQN